MKKLLLLLLFIPLAFACSSDDSSSSIAESTGENILKIKIKILNSSQSDCENSQYGTNYGAETEYNFYYSNGEVTSATVNDTRVSCETNEILSESFETLQSQQSYIYDTFQYQNGHLISLSDLENYDGEVNFEWTDGNLSRYYKTNNECCYYTIVEYSDYPNNSKYEFGFFFEGEYPIEFGIFKDEYRGVTSSNLPSSVTYIDTSFGSADTDLFYGYEFNNEGRPVKFLVDSFTSDNPTINEFKYTYQVEITYIN